MDSGDGAAGAAVTDAPWYPLGLQPDRAIWRDAQALLQSVADTRARPKTLDWLSSLVSQGFLDERRVLTLDVYGMIPDQAVIDDWRTESLPLPLALLKGPALGEVVGQAIERADALARLLQWSLVRLPLEGRLVSFTSPMSVLCEALLAGATGPAPDARARQRLAETFNAPLRYWTQLEAPFRQLLIQLPEDVAVDASGVRHIGERVLRDWTQQAERAARQVFERILADLDTSARSLRAAALAQSRFTFCLDHVLASLQAGDARVGQTGKRTSKKIGGRTSEKTGGRADGQTDGQTGGQVVDRLSEARDLAARVERVERVDAGGERS